MNLRARKGFRTIIRILDAVNPALVGLAVIGLFLEYTDAAVYARIPNNVISVFFILDFLLRLAAFPAGDYFLRSFGWVDFLAGLPGVFVFVEGSRLLSVFKVVRIGRFFRIIRVLRFLRAFDFMKKMRGDSPWIQQRIMQIGVSVVLIFVGGIVLLDLGIFSNPAFAVSETVYRAVMLTLLGTLLAILSVLIFYMGAVFASDMRTVQLIIDSADAEDYLLLKAEAEGLRDESGGFRLEEGELETVSLLKMAAVLAESAESGGGGTSDFGGSAAPGGLGDFGTGSSAGLGGLADWGGGFGAAASFDSGAGGGSAAGRLGQDAADALAERLDRIEALLKDSNERLVMETLRRAVPAIRNYLKKN